MGLLLASVMGCRVVFLSRQVAEQFIMTTMEQTLTNRTIAVPETRQLDVLSGLLERRGATVLRCPLVGIHNAPNPAPVLQWLAAFDECDDMIFLTGEGLRRLLSCIREHAPEREAEFVENLGRARKVVRGPKPNKALKEIGLSAEITAVAPTTEGVIETLKNLGGMKGRTVGVQLYGTFENPPLMEFLAAAGAIAKPVFPYIYADEAESEAVQSLNEKLMAGQLDGITFTSQPQIRRMLTVAKKAGQQEALVAALNNTTVAAVGPIMAAALRERGVDVHVEPTGSFFMKPLVRALEQRFAK